MLKMVEHERFDKIIMMVILANTICLALKWYNSPKEMHDILEYFNNYVFAGVFTIEAILKIYALRG